MHRGCSAMEIGSSARVAVVPVLGEAPRVTGAAPPDAVRTELPAPLTARQADAARAPGEADRSMPGGDVAREVTIDAKTREVVFRAINRESGEVVRQVPDQALLRIKAYARTLRQAGSKPVTEEGIERVA